MSDDFVKLVSQANPALNQYQQTNNSPYPPASEHQLDPFFDDDDDGPDSAFGRPLPMQSQASGLPLTKNSAPPAGVPQGWSFDDEDPNAYPNSSSNPGPPAADQTREKKKRKVPKFKWNWPWQKKEVVLTGERVVALNNPPANIEFCTNYVSTSKYNAATFVPKFLFEQFSKYANLFFLFTAFIQQIPGVSPTNRYTTIGPLLVVLLASAFKEVKEDLKRHQSDSELNSSLAKVLTPQATFEEKKWQDIKVGDVVRLDSDEFIPADMVLFTSSEPRRILLH